VGGDVWFEWYSGGHIYSVAENLEKKRVEHELSAQIMAADSSNGMVNFLYRYMCSYRTELSGGKS
jgi:hypothetical protein